MLADKKAGAAGNGAHQGAQVVALKEVGAAAAATNQEVLMAGRDADERLAALRMMHPLNEVELLEFLQRAIHTDQTQCAVLPPGCTIHLQRRNCASAGSDRVNDGATGGCKAVAVVPKSEKPYVSGGGIHN